MVLTFYYTPKYAIWAFEQFDWFTLTILWLHITLIYLLWRVQVAHIAWIYLFWWIRLTRQQFVANCSSSGRCGSARFTSCVLQFSQTVAETVLSFYYCLIWAHLCTSSSFIDFRHISKKYISWLMQTKFQQGRQSRVGLSFLLNYKILWKLMHGKLVPWWKA